MKVTEKAGMNESEEQGEETYFFDTYAIFEVILGNEKYAPYKDVNAMTTVFNIAELNYNLKKEKSKDISDKTSEKYFGSVVEVTLDDIKEAMDLKIKNKDLSIPDVIGYTVAKRYGVKFLTGDEGFKNFDNVEFVKK